MEHRKGTSSRYLFSSLNGPNSDVHARPLLWCALPTPTSHAAQRAHCEIPFLVRIIPPYSIQLRPFPLPFSYDSTPRLISQFVPPCPRLRHQFYFKSLIFVPNQPSTWSRSAAPARGRTKRRRKKSSRLYLRTALTKSRKREFERFPPPFERASHRWSHQYRCASQHCCTLIRRIDTDGLSEFESEGEGGDSEDDEEAEAEESADEDDEDAEEEAAGRSYLHNIEQAYALIWRIASQLVHETY